MINLLSIALTVYETVFVAMQQQTKYQKIKRATTLVQSYTRGWQVSRFLWTLTKSNLNHKEPALRGCPVSLFHQARKLLRELKYQKRCEEAATTIAAYWHGTQVLGRRWQRGWARVPPRVHVHLPCLRLWLVWMFLPNSPTASELLRRSSPWSLPLPPFPFLILPYFADHTTATSPPPSPLLSLSLSFQFLFTPSTCLLRKTPTASRQARTELRRLKQEVRNKHAVTVIWAYWQGTKVFQPQLWCLLSRCLVSPVHRVPLLSQSHHDSAGYCSSSKNETF